MTTHLNPKEVRLALNGAGINTTQLDIVPSRHGVLVSTLVEDQASATLIIQVHMALFNVPGMDDITRRGPYALKINSQQRKR